MGAVHRETLQSNNNIQHKKIQGYSKLASPFQIREETSQGDVWNQKLRSGCAFQCKTKTGDALDSHIA